MRPLPRIVPSAGPRGFTLVEIALILLILGLLVSAVIQGQQLIQGARVRSIISEQEAVATAVLAFQDRFQALPGDYPQAPLFIACTPPCPAGNGNGRIEDGGPPNESIMVWAHMAGAGFLNASFTASSATGTVAPDNTPQNIAGGYLQVVLDNNWGYSTNPARRHNIKTGNNLPVEVMAEVDRKMDDGLPTSGRFQFSPYAASGDAPEWGGSGQRCLNQDTPGPTTVWNIAGSQANCGGASLL